MCKELEEIYNEGEQSGVQKGIQKGELKKARETVFALLEMGMPLEQITKAVKMWRSILCVCDDFPSFYSGFFYGSSGLVNHFQQASVQAICSPRQLR